MPRTAPAVLLFLMLFAFVSHGQAPPADELLEKGIYVEETQGDLDAAIDIYKRVAAAPDAEGRMVAYALLRIGMCYLKSGRADAAKAVFEKLARQHPEQKSIIARIPATADKPALSLIKEDKKVRAVRISKFLTLVLRHDPPAAGVTLDRAGWAPIDALLSGAAVRGFRIERYEFDEVVRSDPEQRFKVSKDGKLVRASHGHSIPVDLGLSPVRPPHALYHGLMGREFLQAIMMTGLQRGERQFVLLFVDIETAACISMPEGQLRPVILRVAAPEMQSAGLKFFLSEDGLWLTEEVPPQYISIVAAEELPAVCGRAVPPPSSAESLRYRTWRRFRASTPKPRWASVEAWLEASRVPTKGMRPSIPRTLTWMPSLSATNSLAVSLNGVDSGVERTSLRSRARSVPSTRNYVRHLGWKGYGGNPSPSGSSNKKKSTGWPLLATCSGAFLDRSNDPYRRHRHTG
jgi:putative RNA 2'-phosphotransferase